MSTGYITGILKEDPELRYTPQGLAVTTLQLVGERTVEERTKFSSVKVTFFGKNAETYADLLRRNDAVLAHADIRYRTWEDEAGEKHSTINVNGKILRGIQNPQIRETEYGPVLQNCTNQFQILGNLTQKPELRYTPAGDAVIGVGMAFGVWDFKQKQETSHFITLKAWQHHAETLQHSSKGSSLLATGSLEWHSWTAPNGDPRGELQLVAESIEYLHFLKAEKAAPPRPTDKPKLDIDSNIDLPQEEDLPF